MSVAPVRLESSCGLDLSPDAARWFDEADVHDQIALEHLTGPVLDVGCGPGRVVSHLALAGIVTLGIDVSAAAIERCRRRGLPVLHRSVFEPLPGIGRWGAAVLLDGNIGIGGDPVALLRRVRQLVHSDATVLVEIGAPGSGTRRVSARLANAVGARDGARPPTDWFPWAIVGAESIEEVAGSAGLRCASVGFSGHRWFARLSPARS